MPEMFLKLCAEVSRDTKFLHELKDCYPHYQRVLDYINSHSEERDEIAKSLSGSFYGMPGAAAPTVYLLQFLMKSLKWPEVKIAAEERLDDGGNSFHDREIEKLLKIFEGTE